MTLAAVLCAYAAFLWIGVAAARKAKNGASTDLLIAGRALPLWLATLTMTATWVDGGYLLGTVEGTFRSSIASGAQGGLCFGLSLILGGLFFARRMRALKFTTLIDPFEARFGKRWATVLLLPALLGEIFWSAELLVAIGSTFGVMLGGIPWNCYFQRVLSCQTPARAQQHSILSGLLTIAFTVPPLLLGVAAFSYAWPTRLLAELRAHPAETLPMIFQHITPAWIGLLGLLAIIGAVTSSFSASILSAASMFAWNCCYRLWRPDLTPRQLSRLIRLAIVTLGAGATVMALKVQSVQALWFFTSDLIFVLLVPQLVFTLFDRRVNRIGSIAAFVVSLALRLGGGEPLFGVPPLIPYPELLASVLPGSSGAWYDPGTGALLFPCKTVAALAGVITLPVVSRLTGRWSRPRPLRNVHADLGAPQAVVP